jgi:TFIIF-interacting CTD phosphatase-like protein
MSQHYDIYVFTSASENYASQIIDFLNTKTNAIQGMLTSKHCLETSLGLHVKDLRIIRNRSLK